MNVNKLSDGDSLEKKEAVKGNKSIFIIFCCLLLDLLSFTMILPLLPSLLEHYRQNEGNSHVGLYSKLARAIDGFRVMLDIPERFSSVIWGGALGSIFSLLQFISGPIIGALSDVYGRKPVMLLCLGGVSASYATWGLAGGSFALFVVSRVLGGASRATTSVAMAAISDVTNQNTHAKAMALVGLAFSVSFTVGPALGAWAHSGGLTGAHEGHWTAAGVALALSVIDITLVALFLPETLPKERRASSLAPSLSRAYSLVSPLSLIFCRSLHLSDHKTAKLTKLNIVYTVYLLMYSGLEFTLTFLTHHSFGFTAAQQGKMFAVIGITMAVLQGWAARKMKGESALNAARGALWLTPVSFVCTALAALWKDTKWLWLGVFLYSISTAFAVSCLTAVALAITETTISKKNVEINGLNNNSRLADSDTCGRGELLGALRSLGALARALGPLITSILYWRCGPAVAYFIGAGTLIIPALLLQRAKL